ncbi:hypothetical protein SDC9_87068 [bioreactor metagenome]|uniref:Uncharacterized protein n=1 Tax=bioreactor metagenome TaxID=1076179 RepID=A0A644ZI80_9ZZZZ
MAKDELVTDSVANIGNIKSLFLFADFGIKHYVQQQVSEFFFYFQVAVVDDGLSEFIRFFYGVGPQTFVGLHIVPRAFFTQFVHYVEQSSECFQFLLPGVHGFIS